MNVAIPELDGRIITVPLSFKEEQAGVGSGRDAGRPARAPCETAPTG